MKAGHGLGCLLFGLVLSAVPTSAQVEWEPPAPPIENYDEILRELEAGDAKVRVTRGANGLPNILITGYWPPTNDMIRQFSDNPAQNPDGWAGDNWEGRGYNVFAFFPEFPDGPSGQFPVCSWGQGVGDLEVDYQDTTADFAAIAAQIEPVAIITFSRGFDGNSWEVEFVQRNLETWFDDFTAPLQPTPAPPDARVEAGFTRCSTLPAPAIVDAVDSAGISLNAFIDFNGFGGGFLSEFIAYQGTWHHGEHSVASDPARTLTAGHIHVGYDACEVELADWITATEVTLRTLIDYLDNFDPMVVGDRCPTCCLGEPSGTAAGDAMTDLEVSCSITSHSCCRETGTAYGVRCSNNENFDVAVDWNVCNDNDDCAFADATDVSFPNLLPQDCEDFGCGVGLVSGTNCGCAGTEQVVLPAGTTQDVYLGVQCPSWPADPYGCDAGNSCCECMQGLEDQCAANSTAHTTSGDRACLRLEWLARSTSTTIIGRRQRKTTCVTLSDCPGDGAAVGPGEPVFPLVVASPVFASLPPAGSATLLLEITNAALDARQFDYELLSVNSEGGPALFSLTPLSGVASDAGSGTPNVTGQLLPIPPDQTLLVAVQVDAVPLQVSFENEIFMRVTDPLAALDVPVSTIWVQSPLAGTQSGAVPTDLSLRKFGDDLRLFWNESCLMGDDDFAIYEGILGEFSSHVPVTCSNDGSTNRVVTPASFSTYYLVVPTDGSVEGSYGLESDGTERQQSALACRSQAIGACR